MYKHVIFDLDGTLLNTIDDLAAAGNWVCRNHGWPVHTVEEYKYFVGNGMARLAERFAPEDWRTPERIAALLEEFMPYYNAHKEDKTAPYPGIAALLDRLKGAGVRMAVLSNKDHSRVIFPASSPLSRGRWRGCPPSPTPPCSTG